MEVCATQRTFLTSALSLLALQFKEFLGTYNKVTENCFMDCVKDFTSRDVKPDEVSRKWFVKAFRSLIG